MLKLDQVSTFAIRLMEISGQHYRGTYVVRIYEC